MNLFRVLVVAILFATPFAAADAQTTIVFENADFVLSDDRHPPDDAAPWQRVSLPHEWRRTHPGKKGTAWYRMKFARSEISNAGQAINLVHRRASWVDFHVNGSLVGSSRDIMPASAFFATPVYLSVPPALMRTGENVIHARVRADADPVHMQGFGRLMFGDGRTVRKAAIVELEKNFYAERAFFVMALTAGLIAFFLWIARRSDRMMLWFSATFLSWGIASLVKEALRWSDYPMLNALLGWYVVYGLVVPTVILCLRSAGLRWKRFELALWAYMLVEVSWPAWRYEASPLFTMLWPSANTVLILVGAVIMLKAAKRPLAWSCKIQVVALIAMAGLMFQHVMRYLGWIDVDSAVLRHYHVPLMLLALGIAIFERHVLSVWRIESSNVELERRVVEKAREIEAAHARIEEANLAHSLARERQRILGDMHDGVGASLIGLLRYVQSGKSDAQDLERRVRAALQEMRIAVDALEPAEGDLAAVLGKLRYRLEPLVAAAGVRFVWDVAELPRVEALEPPAVFSIQRIVLEAIANVLNHASAREIRVSVRDKAVVGVEIRLEDDGKGFDTSIAAAGLGLRSMRARAERLGAKLEIRSNPQRGTTVSLVIPYRLQRGAAETPDMAFPDAAAARSTLARAAG